MKGIFKSSKKGGAAGENPPSSQATRTGESSAGPVDDATPKRKKGLGLFKKLFGRSSRPHETPGYNSPYGTQSVDAAGDLRILRDPQLLYKSQLELHLDETNQYIILFDLHDLVIGTTYNSIHDLRIHRVSKTEIRATGPDFEETITIPSNRTSKIITRPPSELHEQPVPGRKASSPPVFSDGPSSTTGAPKQAVASPLSEPRSPQHNPGRKFSEPILSVPPNIDKSPFAANRVETVAEEKESVERVPRKEGPTLSALPTRDEPLENPPPPPTKTRSASTASKGTASGITAGDESLKTVPILSAKARSASTATKAHVVEAPVAQDVERTLPVVPSKPRSASTVSKEKTQPNAPIETTHDLPQKDAATTPFSRSHVIEDKTQVKDLSDGDFNRSTTTGALGAVPQSVMQEDGVVPDEAVQTDPEGRQCRSSTIAVGSEDIVVKIEQEEENLLEKVKDTTQLDVLTRGRPRANTRRLPTRKGIESRIQQDDELIIPEKDSFTVPDPSAPPARGPGFGIPVGGFQLPPPVARPTGGDGPESNGLAARNSAVRRSFAGPSPAGGPMPMFNPAEAKLRKTGGDSVQPKAEAADTKQMDFRDVLKKKNPNA